MPLLLLALLLVVMHLVQGCLLSNQDGEMNHMVYEVNCGRAQQRCA